MAKRGKINVQGNEIVIYKHESNDYISLTDIARYKDPEHIDVIIQNWLRNRNTIELLGFWEIINNPDFKPLEFEGFRKQAGLNSFVLTPKRWIETTNAIGIVSKSGRNGGTFAHQDIALEFASWISIEFKLYIIKEFQRLKDDENNRLKLEWNLQRTLAKINYHIHTDAIKETLIPKEVSKHQAALILPMRRICSIRRCSALLPKSGASVTATKAATYVTMQGLSNWLYSAIWKASMPCLSNRDYRKVNGSFSSTKRLLRK